MMLINSSKCCGKKCNLSIGFNALLSTEILYSYSCLLAFRKPLHERVGGGRFAALLHKKGGQN